MYDFLPTEGSTFILVLCALMAYFLAFMLTWAAVRNHFWRHTTRPVVIASAILFLAFGVEFTKRVVIFFVPAGSVLYTMLSRSGSISDVVNILLLIGMASWFMVVAVAYPDTRRGKGEPHDRTSHVG